MRFIDAMPTLASVTPPVPPRMIISAGMLMKEAGLVPSIIELKSREPKANPIPMAVEAFIASLHRLAGKNPSILTRPPCTTAVRAAGSGRFYVGSSSTAVRCGGSRWGSRWIGASGGWRAAPRCRSASASTAAR